MVKRIAILQSNYIPWKGYFDLIRSVDEFVLLDCVQYTRRDWRNRNVIKTASGPLWLTIPVKVKGKYEQSIESVEIAEPGWTAQHWKSIQHAYAKAPCFAEVRPLLEDLYGHPGVGRLSAVNHRFLTAICAWLGLRTPIRWSSEFDLADGPTERLLSICRQSGATSYLSGPAAQAYLDVARFTEHGIAVEWADYRGYPEYPQLHPPFEHRVSILDLLVHTGSNALQYFHGL